MAYRFHSGKAISQRTDQTVELILIVYRLIVFVFLSFCRVAGKQKSAQNVWFACSQAA